MDLKNVRFFFMNKARGESDRGEWYKITLAIDSEVSGKSSTFSLDFFVDAVLYAKTEGIAKFEEVDAVFLPTARGNARLVSIEGL